MSNVQSDVEIVGVKRAPSVIERIQSIENSQEEINKKLDILIVLVDQLVDGCEDDKEWVDKDSE